MTNPNDFILNSKYDSLKNDTQENEISISISSGTTFGAATRSDLILGSTDLTAGTINAGIRAQMKTSNSSNWGLGTAMVFQASTTDTTFPFDYTGDYIAYLYRVDASTVRLEVSGYGYGGGGGANDFRINEDVTVQAQFSTFLSPFDN